MSNSIVSRILLVFIAVLFFGNALAQTNSAAATASPAIQKVYHSHAAIKQSVEQFLRQQLGQQPGDIAIKIGRLDPRLRLAQCPTSDVQLYLPPGSTALRSSAVGIRCASDAKPWSIYVPVRVSIETKVVVAVHPLPRGHRFQPGDLKIISKNVQRLQNGYFKQVNQVVGHVARQSIAAGQVITPSRLQAAQVIRRGEQVTINAILDGLKVTMYGVALRDGRKGQIIPVRNLSSKRIVEAKVVSPQTVQILL